MQPRRTKRETAGRAAPVVQPGAPAEPREETAARVPAPAGPREVPRAAPSRRAARAAEAAAAPRRGAQAARAEEPVGATREWAGLTRGRAEAMPEPAVAAREW